MISEERTWESLKLSAWYASDMYCRNQQNKFIWGVFKGIIHKPFPFIYNPGSVITSKLHFLAR